MADAHEAIETQRWFKKMKLAADLRHTSEVLRIKMESKERKIAFCEWLNLLSRNYVLRKGKFIRRISNRRQSRYFIALKKYT